MFTQSTELFQTIRRVLAPVTVDIAQVSLDGDFPPSTTSAFVDCQSEIDLRPLLEKLASRAIYTVLIDNEEHLGESVPSFLCDGLADDLVLTPLRPLELLGKLKHFEFRARVDEVVAVNANLKNLIEKFEEDLRTARAIQRSLIPDKFAPVSGLKVSHKYLSGLKSGGDYLDFFEFEDKTHVGVLMSDSTGYGLSSAFMSVILKLAVKFSKDDFRSPTSTISKIFDELELTMKPKENLSIFYGIINRKTFDFTFASSGSIRFVHQMSAGDNDPKYSEKNLSTAALTKGRAPDLKDQRITLQPSDRLVIFSDGFSEVFQDEGSKGIERVITKSYGADPVALINDFTFRVKSRFESEDDMPTQDCSVMVIDVEKRLMRLAK